MNRNGVITSVVIRAKALVSLAVFFGALVVADIVLKDGLPAAGEKCRAAALKDEILDICRDALPAHKIPTAIRFVPSLAVAPSGKLARPHA